MVTRRTARRKMNLHDVWKGSPHGPEMCFTSNVSCELMENCGASQKICRSRLVLPALMTESWDGKTTAVHARAARWSIKTEAFKWEKRKQNSIYWLSIVPLHWIITVNHVWTAMMPENNTTVLQNALSLYGFFGFFFLKTLLFRGVKKAKKSY